MRPRTESEIDAYREGLSAGYEKVCLTLEEKQKIYMRGWLDGSITQIENILQDLSTDCEKGWYQPLWNKTLKRLKKEKEKRENETKD